MLSFGKNWLCFSVVVVTWSNNVIADGDPEKCKIFPLFKECASQFNVDFEELKAMKSAGSFESMDSCLLACVAKKMGIIDPKGMFDADTAKNKLEEFVPKEFHEKIASIINTCEKVNDAQVKDGDEGCERAKHLFLCVQEQRAGLKMDRK